MGFRRLGVDLMEELHAAARERRSERYDRVRQQEHTTYYYVTGFVIFQQGLGKTLRIRAVSAKTLPSCLVQPNVTQSDCGRDQIAIRIIWFENVLNLLL